MEIGNTQNTKDCITAVDVTGDREARSKVWYVAKVRMNSERKNASKLNRLGYETYVPTQTVIRQWSDRKKKVEKVLIPLIVFVMTTQERIKEIQVLSFISSIMSIPGQSKPAIVPDEQIQRLKFLLNNADSDITFHDGHFQPGEKIEIVRGALRGLQGYIVKMNVTKNKSCFAVKLDYIGYAIVSISSVDVKKVKE